MAAIQITKIQLRRGLENSLQPSSLDAGEQAFTLDSGRLFIGVDPSVASPFQSRAIYPYANVEILTEAADETFARILDRFNRAVGPLAIAEGVTSFTRLPYLQATLGPASTYTAVAIQRIDPLTGILSGSLTDELSLVALASGAGVIDYFVDDGTDTVRAGQIAFVHDGDGTSDEARMVDDCVQYPTIAGNGTPILVDTLFTTGLQFRVMRVSDSPGQYRLRLEYLNTTANTYTVRLRVMVSTVLAS